MATAIHFNLGDRRITYSLSKETPPASVRRFDVPRRFQGQIVTYAFGRAGYVGDESGVGDPWLRVYDASDRTTTYYRRTRSTVRPTAPDRTAAIKAAHTLNRRGA